MCLQALVYEHTRPVVASCCSPADPGYQSRPLESQVLLRTFYSSTSGRYSISVRESNGRIRLVSSSQLPRNHERLSSMFWFHKLLLPSGQLRVVLQLYIRMLTTYLQYLVPESATASSSEVESGTCHGSFTHVARCKRADGSSVLSDRTIHRGVCFRWQPYWCK